MLERSVATCVLCVTCAGCTSLGDLDAAAKGSKGGAGGRGSDISTSGAGGAGSSGTTGASASGGASVQASGGAVWTGGTESGGAVSSGGSNSATGGRSDSQSGGVGNSGGVGGSSGTANGGVAGGSGGNGGGGASTLGGSANAGVGGSATGGSTNAGAGGLPELPIELPDPPVSGQITFSADATWEVDGTQIPTFEIRTPTASYWLVKSLASIVSIVDAATTDPRQWIDYSSAFRPLRSVPSFGSFGASPKFVTTLDAESQTPRHLRLLSETASKDWQLAWDFYLTHVTITVNRAPPPYGFAYRGVPGGALDGMDSLLSSEGTARSAQVSSVGDFPGSNEWASLADGSLNRALFLIQHGDDALADRYQVKDSDSAMILFGDGKLTQVPLRFSLGLVDSAEAAKIVGRVQYVVGAIE